jgi:hypothetical protein
VFPELFLDFFLQLFHVGLMITKEGRESKSEDVL